MLRETEPASATGPEHVERPEASSSTGLWVSDALAEVLRKLDIPYAAMNPGASYRGLHDSLVNHLGNDRPQMLLCLHEEHAVHIAQGWAKVTEKPMISIVHSNVGLMHAAMAIFNAWCDRVPMLLLGATGPVDAARRRPWVDWIHTAKDQGALIRGYTKWDDQPASLSAAIESVMRAAMIAETRPHGPTYVCFDAGLQETALPVMPEIPDRDRFLASQPSSPAPDLVTRAVDLLLSAQHPLILAGRVGRSETAWNERVSLAEKLGALVLTDLKAAAAFPTMHPLHATPAGLFVTEEAQDIIRQADVILSLDWIDLGGTLRTAYGGKPVSSTIMQASLDQTLHNGWSMDYQALPPIDLNFANYPDPVVSALLSEIGRREIKPAARWQDRKAQAAVTRQIAEPEVIRVRDIATTLKELTKGHAVSLVRIPSAWSGEFWDIEHPLDYLGYDGGGGLASGPGIAVGSGLALRGTGRLPISVLGDGDYLMGATALWTAARYGIPTLIIVANNRSFYNDEVHQERVARERGRPVMNKSIGQHIGGPNIDLAALARAQGVVGIGPVENPEMLRDALSEAIEAILSGKAVVVDVVVKPGYEASTARSLVRSDS